VNVLQNESLQKRNTLRLQSAAEAFVNVNSDEELRGALQWARQNKAQVIPLGQGSNVVLAGDLNALVVQQVMQSREVLEEDDRAVVLRVSAGENWHSLVQWSLSKGYFGLENLALIPGTVGAAPIQNIGAYGVELSSFVRSVHALSVLHSEPLTFSASECGFAYRDSIFKRDRRDTCVVTSLDLVLSKESNVQCVYPTLSHYLHQHNVSHPTPMDVFNAVVAIRSSRLPDPATCPNAGSFFKNPVLEDKQFQSVLELAPDIPHYPQADGKIKVAAAWLIEQCGWKGRRVGRVGVHREHALVLVNCDGGDGKQLLALADDIKRSVFDFSGLELDIEPRVYGLE
jgi:UDP-N-acetylmuramate dehydrogenase